MQLIYGSRRLERAFREPAYAVRLWGPDVGRRYVERLHLVQAAASWGQLFLVRSLNLHPLHGDRADDFALRLTGRWRIILRPGENNAVVRIIAVEDYHD